MFQDIVLVVVMGTMHGDLHASFFFSILNFVPTKCCNLRKSSSYVCVSLNQTETNGLLPACYILCVYKFSVIFFPTLCFYICVLDFILIQLDGQSFPPPPLCVSSSVKLINYCFTG